jgi:hypothetical protein
MSNKTQTKFKFVGGTGLTTYSTCKPHHGRIIYFLFFLFCSKVVWLIGPGIFRGNCPFGSFKGRYAGRIGRQNWKSFNFFPVIEKVPLSHSRVNPTTCFRNNKTQTKFKFVGGTGLTTYFKPALV